jgi:hypothetical protein
MRRKNFFLHFCPPFDDRAHRIEKTKPRFFSIAPFLFLFETAPATQESLHRALSESRKEKQRQTPALSEKHRSNRTMDEANDALEPVAVLDNDVPKFPIGDRPKTINDLPKELLVSAFEAVDDLRYVRHTVPLVCKAWDELYRSQDASPLHETLEVDFTREEVAAREQALRRRCVPGSRIISWAERRAGWVRKLRLEADFRDALEDFSPEDLGRLVAVAGLLAKNPNAEVTF